jgi:ABC-type transporter Mla subunit MlaD
MSTIERLIDEESTLKNNIKDIRLQLKKAIEETPLYKAVLTNTLASTEPKVSQKLAKAHAFRVVRATYDKEEEEEDN